MKGILPLTLQAKQVGLKAILVPKDNAAEASIVEGIYVYGVPDLRSAVSLLQGEKNLPPERLDREAFFNAKRPLEVAMAGGHNLLML